jgi:dihydroorotate dehydrogenase
MHGSWAVSFGMPSRHPDLWRADVATTRLALPKHKLLSVSVVATPSDDWTIENLAEDFARCARWAVDGGADCIEANFSCPNVTSTDGQLYRSPESAAQVAAGLRQAVGPKPLLIKIGHVDDEPSARKLCQALAPFASALVMVNCLSSRVVDQHQHPLFGGEPRGIAGEGIRDAVLTQVRLFARVIQQLGLPLKLVSVGGIGSAKDVRCHLEAGAHAVQLATAAMVDPGIGFRIRRSLASP